MKNRIEEVTVGQFRDNFKSLGYSEKGSELTSGGDLQLDFLNIIDEFVKEWSQVDKNKVCKLTFTSGNDSFHKGITAYTSRHTKGEAVDVVLPENCHSSFIQLLNQYKNPTSHATGGHFHISYRAGHPEGGKSNEKNQSTTQTTTQKTEVTSGSTTPSTDKVPTSDENVKKAYGFMTPFLSSLEPLKQQMQDKINKLVQKESVTNDKKIITEIERIKNIMKL
jgi:hypothetical protein